MIELIYVPNPVARALTILLAECGLKYNGFSPDDGSQGLYIPPLLSDDEPWAGAGRVEIAHPGAAMIYLAEKVGKVQGIDAVQWVMWQTARQAFRHENEPAEALATQLCKLLDERLRAPGRYVAGDDYSIADMMCYPWVINWLGEPPAAANCPNLADWLGRVGGRQAVLDGMDIGGKRAPNAHPLARAIEIQAQYMLSGDPVVKYPPGRPPTG